MTTTNPPDPDDLPVETTERVEHEHVEIPVVPDAPDRDDPGYDDDQDDDQDDDEDEDGNER